MEPIFDQEFFGKLNTLKLSLNMRLNKGMGGGRKSTAKGTSVEFSDFREYMLGDDIRRIDWNAYGRMDKLYIKQFMEEKEGIFHIFVDTSKSMDFGEHKKSRLALQIAGAFAYLVLNNLDRVYVSELIENSQTRGVGLTGRNSYKKILKQLEAITFDGKTTLSKSIMSRPYNGRGVAVIISDFLDPKGIEEAVKYLTYKQQQIVLIQVLSREELEIDQEGTVDLIDSETKERMKVTISKSLIDRYQKELSSMQTNLHQMARKYQMSYITCVSDESIDKILFEGFKNSGLIVSK